MKLYRNVSIGELISLIGDGIIHGRFNGGKNKTTYNSEYGAVVCTFPKSYSVLTSLIVEIDVREEDVIGTGVGTYFDGEQVEELYIREYTIDQATFLVEKAFHAKNQMSFQKVLSFETEDADIISVISERMKHRIEELASSPV